MRMSVRWGERKMGLCDIAASWVGEFTLMILPAAVDQQFPHRVSYVRSRLDEAGMLATDDNP